MIEKEDQQKKIESNPPAPRMNVPLFLWGTFLMIALSFLPLILAKPGTNHADHSLATLIFWSMSAALVRGFGYIPTYKIPRWLLGGWAAFGSAVAAALLWLFSGGWQIIETM